MVAILSSCRANRSSKVEARVMLILLFRLVQAWSQLWPAVRSPGIRSGKPILGEGCQGGLVGDGDPLPPAGDQPLFLHLAHNAAGALRRRACHLCQILPRKGRLDE